MNLILQISDLQAIVGKLMFAASKTVPPNFGDEVGYEVLRAMLNSFAVGTDKGIKNTKSPD
jgi:hypothetical protein